MKEMRILHLPLKKEWFNRHLQDKSEDYRAITPYWLVRLCEWADGDKITMRAAQEIVWEIQRGWTRPNIRPKQYDVVEAKNGYASNAPKFRKKYKTVKIGIGNPDWGAPEHLVFIIKLGEIVELSKLNKTHDNESDNKQS